jgi:hypothetical protein
LKKNLRNIGIFILGVIATIFITKIGDKISPSDNNVVVDKIKDTIFVIEVNKPKPKKIEIADNSDELTKEIKYWKNIANRSSKRLNNLEEKITKLEISNNEQIPVKNSSTPNKSDIGIEKLKKDIEKLKGTTNTKTEYIADKGLNQVITNIESYFPNKNGYIYSGTTNLLELDCPDFNNDEKYVDVDFLIKDKSLLNDVSAIFVSMIEINDKVEYLYVYDSYYKPQIGYNHLRVRNVKNRKTTKYKFHFGLMLKSDSKKSTPRIHGINCSFKK